MKTKLMLFVLCGIILSAAAHAVVKGEYPEPMQRRSEWLCLNGSWDFAETDDDNATYLGDETYPDKIIVPFCREASVSGLNRKGFVRNVWYRRNFTVPANWKSERVRLHIGACDYRTTVWVNGTEATTHTGSSAPIIADITELINKGENTIIVHAYDDVRTGEQPAGKQCPVLESAGCSYTRVTGIWQTVWLEGVGSSYIERFTVNTDIDTGNVYIKPVIRANDRDLTFKAAAFADGKLIASGEDKADWRNSIVTLNIKNPRLWSVEDPYLYELKLVLKDKEGNNVDTVYSYFGMREVTIDGAAILINKKPVFQRTVLDQGYYPDGIWTSPTDEALVKDIKLSKDAGFNGARLHQKVFEPRFLYHADKMGYLVWGEYPNWVYNRDNKESDLAYIDEWRMILERDVNHPSIIGWCPFNETPDTKIPLQNRVVNLTRDIDPSRPVLESSGWAHGHPDPEVLDDHDYTQIGELLARRFAFGKYDMPVRYGGGGNKPFFISEYGGIGWTSDPNAWGYGNIPQTKEEFYTRLKGITDALLGDRFSFGYCYTQLYDIEQEQNGIYYYDRTPKFDMKRIRSIFTAPAAYEKNPPVAGNAKISRAWKTLMASAKDEPSMQRPWSYTIKNPGEGWEQASFDDSAWKTGYGLFAGPNQIDHLRKTVWEGGEDIWMRRHFSCDDTDFDYAALVIYYDESPSVYVNGKLIFNAEQFTTNYVMADVTDALKKALKKGDNVIAAHMSNTIGAWIADMGILIAK